MDRKVRAPAINSDFVVTFNKSETCCLRGCGFIFTVNPSRFFSSCPFKNSPVFLSRSASLVNNSNVIFSEPSSCLAFFHNSCADFVSTFVKSPFAVRKFSFRSFCKVFWNETKCWCRCHLITYLQRIFYQLFDRLLGVQKRFEALCFVDSYVKLYAYVWTFFKVSILLYLSTKSDVSFIRSGVLTRINLLLLIFLLRC